MVDWNAVGNHMGTEVAAKRMLQAELPFEDDLTFEQTKSWIDGVLDGIEGAGQRAKGIRISFNLLNSLRSIQDNTLNDHYRGYPFAPDEKLWPADQVQVVLA